LDKARSNLQRAKGTGQSGAYSAQQLEELQISLTIAEAAHQSAIADLDNVKLKLSQTRIIATDNGVVTAKTGVLGEVVNAGAEIFRIIRQGKLEWKPEVDARQLATIREGQVAQLTLTNGQTAKGVVRVASPAVNPQTGRAIVYVTLEANTAARAGMFASGTLEFEKRDALSLPQTAIVLRDGRAYVWFVDKDNHVTSKVVTTGRSQGDRVEITEGITADTRVVAAGGAFLSEGAKVTIASAKAGSTNVVNKTANSQERAQ
jgi:RND family efflux transporter MFP subunit